MKPVVVVDKVIQTATRLFYAQGYNLTGINQIVEEANVSKASLYAHFPAKSDILNAYLTELYKGWFIGLAAYTANMNTPLEKLIAIGDFRLERQLTSDFGGCPWVKISAEVPKSSKKVFERAHNFKQELKAHILDLVKQLKRPKSQPLSDELVAENIFLLLEGAQMMVTISKTRDALDDAKKIILQLL